MKCPMCGIDNPYHHGQDTQQDYHMRSIAQYQNMRGMAQSMTNPWNRQYAESRGTCEPESETPKPDPKQTAWVQFKDLIKRIIP